MLLWIFHSLALKDVLNGQGLKSPWPFLAHETRSRSAEESLVSLTIGLDLPNLVVALELSEPGSAGRCFQVHGRLLGFGYLLLPLFFFPPLDFLFPPLDFFARFFFFAPFAISCSSQNGPWNLRVLGRPSALSVTSYGPRREPGLRDMGVKFG